MGLLPESAALANASTWAAELALFSLKGLLLLLLGEVLLAVLRPRAAAFRHMVRSLTLTSLLLLPLLSVSLPHQEWGWLPNPGPSSQGIVSNSALENPFSPQNPELRGLLRNWRSGAAIPAAEDRAASVIPSWSAGFANWSLVAVAIWSLGAVFFLGRLLFALVSIRLTVLRSSPLVDPSIRRMTESLREEIGLTRPVRILRNQSQEVALSVGFWRATVILPEIARTWDSARIRSILLHELCHVKRWDNLLNLGAQVACALNWANPLAWRCARLLVVDREKACDDMVLASGTRPSDYAGHLLGLARSLGARRPWAQLEVSQASALKDRLQAVLNPSLDRRTPGLHQALGAVVAFLLILLPTAVVYPWHSKTLPAVQPDSQWVKEADRTEGLRKLTEIIEASVSPVSFRERQGQREAEAPQPPASSSSSVSSGSGPRAEVVMGTVNGLAVAGLSASSVSRADNIIRPGSRTTPLQQLASLPPEQGLRRTTAVPVGNISSRPKPPPASGGAPPPPPDDTLTAEVVRIDLGTLGQESRAIDVNDLGQVVGESRTTAGLVRPFLWSKGSGMVDLATQLTVHSRSMEVTNQGEVLCETFNSGVFKGFVWSEARGLEDIGALDNGFPLTLPNAMNESGIVVGGSRNAQGILRAFAWSSQSGIVELPTEGWSEALDVNERGQIAGYANDRAFLWTPEGGVQMIGPEEARLSVATAVNNSGQVVGYASYPNGLTRAFFWSPEEGILDLGSNSSLYPYSLALGINENGQVVGQSLAKPEDLGQLGARAFRWTPENGLEDLGPSVPGRDNGRLVPETKVAINAFGQVVGAYGESGELPALLWTDLGAVELKGQSSNDELEREALAINNNNQIAGSILDLAQHRRAVLWEIRIKPTPKSEPE